MVREKGRNNHKTFFVLKIIEIVMAAAIPIVALFAATDIQKWISALLCLIGIIEAVLQLGTISTELSTLSSDSGSAPS